MIKTPSTSLLLFILAICVLSACTPEYLTEKELQEYVIESETLNKSREFKDYKIQMTYRPNDLLVAQELGGEIAPSKTELDRLTTKYKNYDYFIFSLSKDDKEALYAGSNGFDQFSELVQTLSFRMTNYVNATTSGADTLEVADYVFPRTYGMGMSTNLMFVFNKEKSLDDEWVQVNVKEFGMGLGNQVFRFNRKELDNHPHINFKVKE